MRIPPVYRLIGHQKAFAEILTEGHRLQHIDSDTDHRYNNLRLQFMGAQNLMKQYSIVDEFGYEEDYSYLNDLLDLAIEKLQVAGIFSIIFIGDERMHEMNLEFRGIDRTTDVLSFALNDKEEDFEEEVNVLGDIFISIPKTREQAREYAHSVKRELSFLTIHGLLHLLGYDHMNKDDEAVMFGLQKEVLEDAGITK